MASRNKQFILSLGRNNVQTLKEYQREKLATTNGNLATTKQFQKHFKLASKEATLAFLKDDYNNDLRARITAQKTTDKNDWNDHRIEVRDAISSPNRIFIQEVTLVFLKKSKESAEPFVRGAYTFNVSASSMASLHLKTHGNFDINLNGFRSHGVGVIQSEINRLSVESATTIRVEKYVIGRTFDNRDTTPINRIRMKDGGTCVFDYIIKRYGHTRGLKKKMNLLYLESVFGEMTITEGVCIDDIMRLCEKESISYYIFDIDDKILYQKSYEACRYMALMFRLHDKHLWGIDDEEGIDDKNRRKSLLETQKSSVKSSCHLASRSMKTVVDQVLVKNETLLLGNDYLMSLINSGEMKKPFRFRNVRFKKGQVESFTQDNRLYVTFPTNDEIQRYVEEKGARFQGENEVALLHQIYTEVYGKTIKENDLISTYSQSAYRALHLKGVKDRAHFGAIAGDMENMLKHGKYVASDIVKCYSSILDSPSEDWITLGIADEVVPYERTSGDLQLGLYFVRTDDMTLFHGDNWYSSSILNYARGISPAIKYEIVFMVLPGGPQASNRLHFKEIVDVLMKTSLGEKNIKNILNSLVGFLGKTENKYFSVGLSSDINEVWHRIKKDEHGDMFIKGIYEPTADIPFDEYGEIWRNAEQRVKEGTEIIHLFGNQVRKEKLSNNLPMWIQVLDQSNIKLHKMGADIGGKIVFRKTDMILSVGGVFQEGSCGRFGWGGYKEMNNLDLNDYRFSEGSVEDRHVYHYFENNSFRNVDGISSSSQWRAIFDECMKNKGMLVSGRAGTGKSYLIEQWIKEGLIEDDPSCRLSFTNASANNISGTTLNTAFGIDISGKTGKNTQVAKYKNKKVLIVDEVGMIRMEMWKFILLLRQTYPELMIILIGNDWQARPIEKEGDERFNDFNYFESDLLGSIVNWGRVELTEMFRYDKELWDWSGNFYLNGVTDGLRAIEKSYDANATHMCFYNNTRKAVNKKIMRAESVRYPHSFFLYNEHDNTHADDVWIYSSLPVMCVSANSKLDIFNSETFVVESCDEGRTIIKMKRERQKRLGEVLEVPVGDFHKHFVCSYASTVLKSQGATISKNIVVWDASKILGDRHLGYTCMTRAKLLSQIAVVIGG